MRGWISIPAILTFGCRVMTRTYMRLFVWFIILSAGTILCRLFSCLSLYVKKKNVFSWCFWSDKVQDEFWLSIAVSVILLPVPRTVQLTICRGTMYLHVLLAERRRYNPPRGEFVIHQPFCLLFFLVNCFSWLLWIPSLYIYTI